MSLALLCRFDVLCVVRDIVDPVQDQRLAEFVVGSHAASHPDAAPGSGVTASAPAEAEGVLSQALLRKYITYAKQHCRPVMSQVRHAQ